MSTTKPLSQVMKGVFSGAYEAFVEPEEPVELGEVVLGTLQSEQAKALYSVAMNMAMSSEQTLKDIWEKVQNMGPDEKQEQKKAVMAVRAFKGPYQAMMSVFWQMCYEEFPQARDPEVKIGIRKGWKVVVYKSPSIGNIFGQIFGGE